LCSTVEPLFGTAIMLLFENFKVLQFQAATSVLQLQAEVAAQLSSG
jgi:hypothetical protein